MFSSYAAWIFSTPSYFRHYFTSWQSSQHFVCLVCNKRPSKCKNLNKNSSEQHVTILCGGNSDVGGLLSQCCNPSSNKCSGIYIVHQIYLLRSEKLCFVNADRKESMILQSSRQNQIHASSQITCTLTEGCKRITLFSYDSIYRKLYSQISRKSNQAMKSLRLNNNSINWLCLQFCRFADKKDHLQYVLMVM